MTVLEIWTRIRLKLIGTASLRKPNFIYCQHSLNVMRGTSKKLIMQDCKNYARNENSRIFVYALREKCPNTEFFLVRIFPYLD